MLKDINPGIASSSFPFRYNGSPVAIGGKVFFGADDTAHGWELWSSDGTSAGTTLVADIAPGRANSDLQWLTALNGIAYFSANDGAHGVQLWRSDGTPAGTYAIPGPVNPRPIVSGDGAFAASPDANLLFFYTIDASGDHLWRSDGTATGTYIIQTPQYDPFRTVVWGAQLAYTSGTTLWVSDGTPGGTSKFDSAFTVGPIFCSNATLYTIGGYNGVGGIYSIADRNATPTFIASISDNGQMNFVGMAGPGMIVVSSLHNNNAGSYDVWLYSVDLAAGVVTTLGNAGTLQTGAVLGTAIKIPGQDRLLLPVNSKTTGNELWVIDGTVGGTHLLKDINPGPSGGVGGYWAGLGGVDGLAFFAGNDGVNGYGIWTTDGTADGTHLLRQTDFVSTRNSTPTNFVPAGPNAYFGAFDAAGAYNLYSTDGSATGTRFVKSGFSGGAWLGGLPSGKLLFASSDTGHGTELWSSDGTPGGTALLDDLTPGPASSSVTRVGTYAGKVYFLATGALWVSDGTLTGTQKLTAPPTTVTAAKPLVGGSALYFLNLTTSSGTALYETDGTPSGTRPLVSTTVSTVYSGTTAADGTIYVAAGAKGGVADDELFKYDPSANDFVPVKPKYVTTTSGASWAAAGNVVVFKGSSVLAGSVWRSDGTAAGTFALPMAGLAIQSICSVNGRVAILAEDSATNYYLYSTDGTAAGTHLIRTLGSLPAGASLVSVGDRAFFRYDDGHHGTELWVTDGTDAGTALYQDMWPGPGWQYSASGLAAWGPWLLGGADDGVHGVEPFAIRRTPPKVLSATFDEASPAPAAAHAIELQLTDNLGPILAATPSEIVIRNLATGVAIDSVNIAVDFDDVRDIATITFPSLPGGSLPDGRYSLTLKGSTVDLLGVQLDGNGDGTAGDDFTFNFEQLPGDANHDGYVNDADQAIVTANLGQNNAAFSQGDFNGDGTVDAADEAVLNAHWHEFLPLTDVVKLPATSADDAYTLTTEPDMVDVLGPLSSATTPLYRIPTSSVTGFTFPGGSGGNDSLHVTSGVGSYSIDADTPMAAGSPNISIQVDAGATVALTADQHLAALDISGGTVNMPAAAPKTLSVGALSITGQGLLDLGQGALFLDIAATPESLVRQYLENAYNADPGTGIGNWLGKGGITSSDAIASHNGAAPDFHVSVGYVNGTYANDPLIGGAIPGQEALATGQILVRPALYGDLNLDGNVDDTDLAIFSGLGQYNKPTDKFGWFGGDLNYDGKVDDADLQIFSGAGNYNAPVDVAASSASGAAWSAPPSITASPTPLNVALPQTHHLATRARLKHHRHRREHH